MPPRTIGDERRLFVGGENYCRSQISSSSPQPSSSGGGLDPFSGGETIATIVRTDDRGGGGVTGGPVGPSRQRAGSCCSVSPLDIGESAAVSAPNDGVEHTRASRADSELEVTKCESPDIGRGTHQSRRGCDGVLLSASHRPRSAAATSYVNAHSEVPRFSQQTTSRLAHGKLRNGAQLAPSGHTYDDDDDVSHLQQRDQSAFWTAAAAPRRSRDGVMRCAAEALRGQSASQSLLDVQMTTSQEGGKSSAQGAWSAVPFNVPERAVVAAPHHRAPQHVVAPEPSQPSRSGRLAARPTGALLEGDPSSVNCSHHPDSKFAANRAFESQKSSSVLGKSCDCSSRPLPRLDPPVHVNSKWKSELWVTQEDFVQQQHHQQQQQQQQQQRQRQQQQQQHQQQHQQQFVAVGQLMRKSVRPGELAQSRGDSALGGPAEENGFRTTELPKNQQQQQQKRSIRAMKGRPGRRKGAGSSSRKRDGESDDVLMMFSASDRDHKSSRSTESERETTDASLSFGVGDEISAENENTGSVVPAKQKEILRESPGMCRAPAGETLPSTSRSTAGADEEENLAYGGVLHADRFSRNAFETNLQSSNRRGDDERRQFLLVDGAWNEISVEGADCTQEEGVEGERAPAEEASLKPVTGRLPVRRRLGGGGGTVDDFTREDGPAVRERGHRGYEETTWYLGRYQTTASREQRASLGDMSLFGTQRGWAANMEENAEERRRAVRMRTLSGGGDGGGRGEGGLQEEAVRWEGVDVDVEVVDGDLGQTDGTRRREEQSSGGGTTEEAEEDCVHLTDGERRMRENRRRGQRNWEGGGRVGPGNSIGVSEVHELHDVSMVANIGELDDRNRRVGGGQAAEVMVSVPGRDNQGVAIATEREGGLLLQSGTAGEQRGVSPRRRNGLVDVVSQLKQLAIEETLLQKIDHSVKCKDDIYEYRYVMLPRSHPFLMLSPDEEPRTRYLTEEEWRLLGIRQTRGWEHCGYSRHEGNVLLFRRALHTDPQSGTLPPSQAARVAERLRTLQSLQEMLVGAMLQQSAEAATDPLTQALVPCCGQGAPCTAEYLGALKELKYAVHVPLRGATYMMISTIREGENANRDEGTVANIHERERDRDAATESNKVQVHDGTLRRPQASASTSKTQFDTTWVNSERREGNEEDSYSKVVQKCLFESGVKRPLRNKSGFLLGSSEYLELLNAEIPQMDVLRKAVLLTMARSYIPLLT